ncbi:MAG: bifunctional 4-hydroxy-3-methylbut-2-enyl diphosphate reductase/30S ribosomal protein S1, partial [Eubacteriales bacterium]|nr:bifunctional 4-hydroxy-3-methylbut-2-enyl diphosphate reductase/30S ribosomal protein S1 [Eubacteriales bacterium]
MAEITLAKSSGFCFGVKRAVTLLEDELGKTENARNVISIGEIIHNRTFTDSIKRRGVRIIDPETIETVDWDKNSVAIIRTHGVIKQVYEYLETNDVCYIDATCPYVKKIYKIVATQPKDSLIIIMGDENHPEVQGIRSFAECEVLVFSDFEELQSGIPKNPPEDKNIILVAQTTYNINQWEKCQKFIKYLYTNSRIFDTICSVTDERQKEILSLSADNDLVVV